MHIFAQDREVNIKQTVIPCQHQLLMTYQHPYMARRYLLTAHPRWGLQRYPHTLPHPLPRLQQHRRHLQYLFRLLSNTPPWPHGPSSAAHFHNQPVPLLQIPKPGIQIIQNKKKSSSWAHGSTCWCDGTALSNGGWRYCSDLGICLVIRLDSPVHKEDGSVVLQFVILISVDLVGIVVLVFLVLHTERSLEAAKRTMYNKARYIVDGQRGRSSEQLCRTRQTHDLPRSSSISNNPHLSRQDNMIDTVIYRTHITCLIPASTSETISLHTISVSASLW